MDVRILTAAFDPQAECAAFAAGRLDAGALVSFVGLCRETGADGTVQTLHLQQYAGFTLREMQRMAQEVAARFRCPDLLVLHRVGEILPGEAIVLVAALSAHRAEAFEAVRILMDYLKTDAPLWKKEIGPQGARWIEPRPQDHERRAAASGKMTG
jgi:molybdopterin synthase catalytic subunit